jgi:hypothetical protein
MPPTGLHQAPIGTVKRRQDGQVNIQGCIIDPITRLLLLALIDDAAFRFKNCY